MRAQLQLPRVRDNHDPLHHFAAFHDAIRDVLAWAPTIVDAEGAAKAGDARFLRDFLLGPLPAHLDDEESHLIPRLSHRRGAWLDGVLALTMKGHERVREASEPVALMLTAVARGDRISQKSWRDAWQAFADAMDRALVFEEGVLLPTARLLLEDGDRRELRDALQVAEEKRPGELVEWNEAMPLVPRRVSAVRTRQANGLDVVRVTAPCPRRRTVDVNESCTGCAHLEEASLHAGGGTIRCAIEDTVGPPRVGDLMTRDVQCVAPDVSALELARLLRERAITGLPVVDDEGRPVGIITQSDLVGAVAAGLVLSELDARALMMHVTFAVDENATLDDAARLIAFEGIHRVPVLNSERVVVGVLSATDLVRWMVARSS